ncbi:cell number regulator 2 [Eurytemora carolleeae]|uniref:cell number regulator 2 n=1 Tax=Eurytemora carolleeae TaxID=1294199 RepID=UPI000C79241B|nr:cell number regulator 2 [Eurytemora carolleeae]|eukprot:XP_023330075.1 cell number regulator 2-like [Eurytemora affinis]
MESHQLSPSKQEDMTVHYAGESTRSRVQLVQPTPQTCGTWHTGFCNCCHDCGTCMCGSCCLCFQACETANALNDSGFLYCLLSVLCGPCVPICLLRMKARTKYGIEGSSCGDCCSALCCTCCTSIQV